MNRYSPRSFAFVCLLLVGACGRIAEPAAADDGDSESDASAPAVVAPPSDARATDDDTGALGCADVPSVPAGGAEDAGSNATYVSFGGDDDRTFHSAYAIGPFASGGDGGSAATVCGDRGVYSVAHPCGYIELAACDDANSAVARRSCIYLSSQLDLRPDDVASRPVGHYVDATGRCWALVDAAIHLDATSRSELGSSQSGTFEVTAVSGMERKTLSGVFVTCVAVRVEHTCK